MSLNIELPNDLMVSEFELKMLFASKLFDQGLVSSGQAAKMVGVSRRTFLETVGRYGVSIFQYENEEELLEDINNA